MEMLKEADLYSQMAHALQLYGIYFLLIFIFAGVVVLTSHKYSEAISSGNENSQQMWKWINVAAWGVGGLLTILVAVYWIYTDMKAVSYTYMVTFEGTSANTYVDSTKFFKMQRLRGGTTTTTPGEQLNLIADDYFLILQPSPFKDGQQFEFSIIYKCIDAQQCSPPPSPTKQIVSINKKADCSGSICKASYKVGDNKFEKTYAKSGTLIEPSAFLAQTV